MGKIGLEKLEASAERVCVKALTMLPPAAAMAIECASEVAGGQEGERLGEIYEAFISAGINKTPVCNRTDKLQLIAQIGRDAGVSADDATDALLRGMRRAFDLLGMSPRSLCLGLNEGIEGGECRLMALPICLLTGEISAIIQLSGESTAGIAELIAGAAREKTDACAPHIIAVGFGGTTKEAEELAEAALTRPVDTPSPLPDNADIERRAKKALGSPGGFKPLAVLAEGDAKTALFCAVIKGCWCTRHARDRFTIHNS